MSKEYVIIDLTADDHGLVLEVAEMLVAEFRGHHPDAWPTVESAIREVRESFLDTDAGPRISRVALHARGDAVGFIGGIPVYHGHVIELHPLVVRGDWQGKGLGRALVADLEHIARARGAVTMWLGTDDETNQTSLGGVNLYPEVWEHVRAIKNLNRHPYEFYLKCGYVITGVMPDANGLGKPDIFMAKRL